MSFNLENTDGKIVKNTGKIDIIPEYLEIQRLIEDKKTLIFVTGGGGTGKSTMIRWLMDEFRGKVLLGAPTAIAAINIGAKTLHSLCLLPPAWILSEDIKELYRKTEIKKAKILIIDEISMVNPNLLDGVDDFFRLNRGNDRPFGGLITIMVGDLFQLPPIVTDEMRELFDGCYDSVQFYSAECFKGQDLKIIELKKTFRQKDDVFIDILLNIRKGTKVAESIGVLNSVCTVTNTPVKGVVRLSPRNAEVSRHNLLELSKINSPRKVFKGVIKGTFKTSALPSPMDLELKVGAQVMFTQNDPSENGRKWINGTVGIVRKMDNTVITVEIINSPEYNGIVEVKSVKWCNYNYIWNGVKSEIERVEVGSYEQFPLLLAWAITIHKSQGRTIDLVHLDLGKGAFETGQTYVALSRCPTMKGISLSRVITTRDILVDQDVKKFYKGIK
jgi:ATP-dependent DNA helicase PIF1